MKLTRVTRVAIAVIAIVTSLFTSGCVSSRLAGRMIGAPNRQRLPRNMEWLEKFQQAMDREVFSLSTRIRVAPDSAELAIAVLEPGDYEFEHTLKSGPDGKGTMSISVSSKWSARVPYPDPPKGTIVVLHGVMMSKDSMLHWAFFLAQENYRVVLVDLRGHGRSTGDMITYGAREPHDLTQVLDELSRRGIVAGRVGVLGLSYGGAMALHWAAHDPRVATVVALAPFSDARKAIGEFSRAVMPKLSSMISADAMTRAFVTAAKRAQFTWEEIDVLAATRRLRSPVLLLHGSEDTWIPPYHSEQIKAAAPAGSRLLKGHDNHVTLSIRLQPIASQVSTWFADTLKEPLVSSGADSDFQ